MFGGGRERASPFYSFGGCIWFGAVWMVVWGCVFFPEFGLVRFQGLFLGGNGGSGLGAGFVTV